MNTLEYYSKKTFEDIKHINEKGNEYWEARELQQVLQYKEWRKIEGVINKAKEACEQSNNNVSDYFVDADKIVKTGISEKKIKDYYLSRYACYLIALSGDNRKKVIALAKTYFAVQTRKQELIEQEFNDLLEDLPTSKKSIKELEKDNIKLDLNNKGGDK